MSHVAILHGWSDDSKSFKPLANFLRANGYDAVPIWLGDYISMDDDVSIEDVAKRMDSVVRQLQLEGTLPASFDLIVHSTGGLVAREWLSGYFGDPDVAGDEPPVKRLVMLAPANFGSRLASTGKSMVGRAFKGWKNGFQTGARMLKALELSSPFAWNLACRDLLVADDTVDDGRRIYGADKVLPFVIVGSRAYEEWPRRLVNEFGSDGTVRVAAANLNVMGATIDFTQDIANPTFRPWASRFNEVIPIAVLPDRDHTSVTQPKLVDRGSSVGVPERVGDLLLQALACDSLDAYRAIGAKWTTDDDSVTERTSKASPETSGLSLGEAVFTAEAFHQYIQVNVHVVDDHGVDVTDYFLEYPSQSHDDTGEAAEYFQHHVLERVDANSQSKARRTLYLDRTDLMKSYYGLTADHTLKMRIVAAPIGNNVGYFLAPGSSAKSGQSLEAVGLVKLHGEEQADRWLRRHSTHLVKIIVPREPSANVFKLKSS
ncbi:MAG: esterase/lipase family protein [Burkholderiales bacterium]|jgi:pimeloyl-ACP methyl ester carboxylesterase|nr:alpha/beta fold hydrolase [Rhodocyclaceae bacterium]MCA3022596.1 alpha/beta fold hydrolase [Rhodocyclaceae bacterium]MCA3051806.1 alpha/beta fold hydrolase [Rhodocyclaceae bacterium]MCA3056388.1 alpha/beta fold hydrolase [Rhodocyclaceae bacterium]